MPVHVDDFFTAESAHFQPFTPKVRTRFYGKVKKVGQLWVTPDGLSFAKQHHAYTHLHAIISEAATVDNIFECVDPAAPQDTQLEQLFGFRLNYAYYTDSYRPLADQSPPRPCILTEEEFLRSVQSSDLQKCRGEAISAGFVLGAQPQYPMAATTE